MPLTGHLSDLSLSELIEFFCNQRKTGRLKVLYSQGQGSFYLQTGSVVDARIGVLRGIDAVYYALTLPNAKFEFGDSDEPIERTINQPWAQVVLEGLRRLDEGVVPAAAFPPGYSEKVTEPEVTPQEPAFPKPAFVEPTFAKPAFVEPTFAKPAFVEPTFAKPALEEPALVKPSLEEPALAKPAFVEPAFVEATFAEPAKTRPEPAFLSPQPESTGKRKIFIAVATACAVIGSVAAIGVPAGWYGRTRTTAAASQPQSQPATVETTTPDSASNVDEIPSNQPPEPSASSDQAEGSNDSALWARRQRDKEKARAREERAASLSPPSTKAAAESAKSGPKKVSVTVTYDESGRVTQASGGDATAVRIARQKRFPPGKAGSATVTIPIN